MRLLTLLAFAALLRPACSGRGTLVAPAAGAPHVAAVPEWRSALQPRSASSDSAPASALQRFAHAIAARRAQGERSAAVPAAEAAATAAPGVTHSPPLPAALMEPRRDDVSPALLGAAATASLSPPSLAAALGEAVHAAQSAESDEDGIGTNATRAGDADATAQAHQASADAENAAAAALPAPDAALEAALAAHAEAAAAYAEQRCPGCAAGGGNCDADRGACQCAIGKSGPTCTNVRPLRRHLRSCCVLRKKN